MPQRKNKPEEIVAKLRQADVLVSQGRSVAEAVRAIGVTGVDPVSPDSRRLGLGTEADELPRGSELQACVRVDFAVILDPFGERGKDGVGVRQDRDARIIPFQGFHERL